MRADRLLIEVIVISRPCVSYPKEFYLPLVTRGPPSLRGGGGRGRGRDENIKKTKCPLFTQHEVIIFQKQFNITRYLSGLVDVTTNTMSECSVL